jgi:hypothetical protein
MTIEERLARIEGLLVLLVDQLQFAFPGKNGTRFQRIETPDFSGEGRLGVHDVFDPAVQTFAPRQTSDPDADAFVRARVGNILATVEDIRKDL